MNTLTRRSFMERAAAGTIAGAIGPPLLVPEPMEEKPKPVNILWITCEDISPHMGCYGDPEARTPNLDELAAEGTRYTRAFSVSGVCAPSRSCLITGMYPTTLGTCHMRCKHAPPEHIRCFPAYLRRAGYYCTNNVKTDYNFDVPPDAWDDCSKTAHWRNRPRADQPFFAVFNFTITHESSIGNLDSLSEELARRLPGGHHDPARAILPPYYPDTELIRRHWAHYYDVISAMDAQVGDILLQLKEDGLVQDTLVFFFSDHGAGLPRAKRWMYDSGLHVPLIIRWPGRIPSGSVSDRLVSFVDFAPTVLSAAGVDIPGHMQGRPFLGKAEAVPRQYLFAARDRMDERYDILRAVRDRRYKYIRNYQPHRPYAQYLSYCESWPVMQEMRRVHDAGGLNKHQRLFFQSVKPVEELYDTETDPHELHNLAGSAEHEPVLNRLRAALDEWLQETQDLGFVPEPELEKWLPAAAKSKQPARAPAYHAAEIRSPALFGRTLNQWVEDLNGGDPLRRVRAIATIGLMGAPAVPVLLAALDDAEPSIVYWAAVGLGHARTDTSSIIGRLSETLQHDSPTARLGAAHALCELGKPELTPPVVLQAMQHPHFAIRLLAVQILEGMDPKSAEVMQALNAALEDSNEYVPRIARHALGLPPKR